MSWILIILRGKRSSKVHLKHEFGKKKLRGKKRFSLFQTTILSCVHVSIAVLYFSFVSPLWFQTGLCDSVVCSCFFL